VDQLSLLLCEVYAQRHLPMRANPPENHRAGDKTWAKKSSLDVDGVLGKMISA
jgi:hypothetical protein